MKLVSSLIHNFEFKSFIKKSFSAFFSRIIGAIAVFILQIFLARTLGVDDFGIFSLSITIVSLLAVFFRFGLDTLLMRMIASKKNAFNNGYARSLSLKIFKFLFIVSILLTMFFIVSADFLSILFFEKESLSEVLVAISPLFFFMVIGFVLGDGFKGVGYSSFGVLTQNTFIPLFFILSYILLPKPWYQDVVHTASIYSFISLTVLLGSLVYWLVLLKRSNNAYKFSLPSLLNEAFPLLLASSGGLLVAWTDMIVLGIYETEYTVGLYAAASKISLLISLILVAVNAVVAPKFSYYFSNDKIEELSLYVKRVSFATLILSLFPTTIIIFYPSNILLIFGKEYQQADILLIVLSIGQFLNVACGSVGYLLVMANYEKIVRNVIWVVAIFNIFLSIMLVKVLGALGVALATALSMSIWNMLLVYAVKRKLGFFMLGRIFQAQKYS